MAENIVATLFSRVFFEDNHLEQLNTYFKKVSNFSFIQFINDSETKCFLYNSGNHIKNPRFMWNYYLYWYKCIEFFGYELTIVKNEQLQEFPSYTLPPEMSDLLKNILYVNDTKNPDNDILKTNQINTKAFLCKILESVKIYLGYHPLSKFFSILVEESHKFGVLNILSNMDDFFMNTFPTLNNENGNVKCVIDKEEKVCKKHTFRFHNQECKEIFNSERETNVHCFFEIFNKIN